MRAALALALAALLPACAAPSVQAAAETRQCQLGRLMLKQWTNSGTRETRWLDDLPTRHYWNPADPAAASVSPALAEAWTRQEASNLFTACPRLRLGLPSNVRFVTPQDRAAAQTLGPHFTVITSFTAPVMSAADDEALITQQNACQGLCGSGLTVHFRWVDGKWAQGQVIGHWLS